MHDAAETLRQRLQADLREAMKSRDKAKLDVLRGLISAIDNAGAVAFDTPQTRDHANAKGYSQYVVTGGGKTEVARKVLSATDIAALFEREIAERRAAADDIARHGRTEEADALRTGAALIESYIEERVLKLQSYLERVGFTGAPRVDFDTLTRLHRGHLENIPYENLDVLLRRPLDFDPRRIFDKLVTNRRGGWCYEMNGLFAWALETIGFRVTRMAGAVIRDRIGDELTGNHLVLLTHLDRDYLTDVGFGDGLYEPVPLAEGEIEQNGFVSRLEFMSDGWWRFHNHQNCGAPSFDFRTEPADPEALARVSSFLQTSERSPFTQNVVFQRRFPDRVEAIRNTFRITAHPDRLERRLMTSADELLDEMRGVFGVDVPEAATLWPLAKERGRIMLAENPL